MKLSWSMFLGVAVALFLLPASQASGAIITIDDFTVTQGSSGGPAAILQCTITANPVPPGGLPSSPQDLTGLKILGGYRLLQVKQTENVGGAACIRTYCDGGSPPQWAVSNDVDSRGNGYIEWNGTTTMGNYSLPTLDISSTGYIHIDRATSDLASTYVIRVYADAANFCSATFAAPVSPGGPVDIGGVAHPWQGATCTQAVLASVKRITLEFDAGNGDSDSGIRKVSAITASPDLACLNPKLFSLGRNATTGELDVPAVPSLDLTDKVASWPATIFAELDVANSGSGQALVYIEDTMPAGMAYVAGSTKVIVPAGFILPEPDTSEAGKIKWTSISNLLGQTTLRFSIQLQQAEFSGTVTNSFHASVPGQPFTDGPCEGSLVFQPPRRVPSLTEWGTIILSLILAVSAVVLMRRRRSIS